MKTIYIMNMHLLTCDDRALIPENWLPNSPDLNPVDYLIWGALQQLVYRRHRFWDVEHLKEVLQTCWVQIDQDIINRAIEQFRKRLSLIAMTISGVLLIWLKR